MVAIGPAVAIAIAGSKSIGIVGIEAHTIEEIVIFYTKMLAMAAPV